VNSAAAMEDLQYVPEMVDAAERVLGPYPFDRYDIVLMPPNFHAGGMENPNANFINVLSAAPGNHERNLSTVVSHELAHSWTGDLVTCATWGDTWLNEGFASYYQARIIDEMHDVERAGEARDVGVEISLERSDVEAKRVGDRTRTCELTVIAHLRLAGML